MPFAPRIIIHPTNLIVSGPTSSTATFHCSAYACDNLAFEWKRINKNLPEKSLVSRNGTTSILSIPNVTSEDVGEYYCVVWANDQSSQSNIAELQFSGLSNYKYSFYLRILTNSIHTYTYIYNIYIYTHTHTHIYIYIYIIMDVCIGGKNFCLFLM